MFDHMSEDEQDAALEMIAAMPRPVALQDEINETVGKTLAPSLEGRRVQSCLHAVDEANTGNLGGGMLPIGWRKETDRTAYLCTDHPGRLPCDKPGNEVGPGCVHHHLMTEHADEFPAKCFTCSEPIPEDEVLSVFAIITLREQLKVYAAHDREFRYTDEIQTLPTAYLCKRHYAQVDVPIRMSWPRP